MLETQQPAKAELTLEEGIERMKDLQAVLEMVDRRLKEMRVIAVRAASSECPQVERDFLNKRFAALKTEISELVSPEYLKPL